MELSKEYIIDDITYTGKELLRFSEEIVLSDQEEGWRKVLFGFIRDLLNEKTGILQQTSGTTGLPKSITLKRSAMIRSAEMTLHAFGIIPGNTALLCLPVDYIAGKMMVVRAMVGRLNLLTIKPSGDPIRYLNRPVDFSAMVPMQLFESMNVPGKLFLINKLLVGGGEISPSLKAKLKFIKNIEILETFGMTETYTHFAFRRISGGDPQRNFRILSGVRIDQDERGCLVVDVPGVTAGKVTTNDCVRFKGSYEFEWLGRYDNMINSGGIKINPEILEDRIRKILNIIYELVIIGLPDPKLGDKVVLVVESRIPVEDLPVDAWQGSLKEQLASHEIPREVLVIPELPRNETMKVLRKDLINLFK